MLTKICHWTLSWINSTESMFSHCSDFLKFILNKLLLLLLLFVFWLHNTVWSKFHKIDELGLSSCNYPRIANFFFQTFTKPVGRNKVLQDCSRGRLRPKTWATLSSIVSPFRLSLMLGPLLQHCVIFYNKTSGIITALSTLLEALGEKKCDDFWTISKLYGLGFITISTKIILNIFCLLHINLQRLFISLRYFR
jgi:hypothetical protein